ncbi:ChbG/HpnK family deacetylase [Mucilaginibacter sp. UR6-11]|uniref:ChbG/HpnK family deacetylase n=1 Tax=Mucilaginibacter sp. UR6-11 TaxID=1435644 RepID=UPI001E348B08|nr:ChbG/HpnK family deacetylase [Mucilaginibacter sp. UR6-11]MCC8426189.1 ChbG/HpnK family deacetylase [Mucilaginibacter sp. UR6-11]
MGIPSQIIVNADDIGLKTSVNQAILYCYEQGYINSTSLLTNMDGFDEAIDLIHNNPVIKNIGVHVNFSEGRPLTDFSKSQFLDDDGYWDPGKTGKLIQFLNHDGKALFLKEINAQIDRAISSALDIVHLDSHLHLHTLPAFYKLFIEVARQRKLKLRLAQTYNENSYLKFYYRKYINREIKAAGINYTALFETVDEFLNNKGTSQIDKAVEIMVHPDFDGQGKLFDHVDTTAINNWISYLGETVKIAG